MSALRAHQAGHQVLRSPLGHQGAHVAIQLRRVLKGRFGAQLSGSWASGEGHLPNPVADRIYSLSDVDILSDHRPDFSETKAVAEAVIGIAELYGLVLAKVSVRQRSEIDALWNSERIETLGCSKTRVGRFLTFWACIGAAEAGGIRYPDDADSARAYGLAKFFFKLCRNSLLFNNYRPRSYRELVAAIRARICDHPAVNRAYDIKIGKQMRFASGDADVLLSEPVWRAALEPVVDAAFFDLLTSITHRVQQWYLAGDEMPAGMYLKQAESFADGREMIFAWQKALRDYRRRLEVHEV